MTKLLTTAEVCAELQIGERTLRRRLKDCPAIRPLRPGRSMLFEPEDVAAIKEAMRCRSVPSPQESEKATASTSSAARFAEKSLRSLRKRRMRMKLKDWLSPSKRESATVVSLLPARK